MWIDPNTLSVYKTYSDIRAANSGTSFPDLMVEQNVLDIGWFPVAATNAPSCNRITEVVEEAAPAMVNGVWTQQWTVRSATASEQVQAKAALQQEIVQATQQRLDDFAKTRQYDGILSACTYSTSPTQKFQAEGQYCVSQRDATWAKLHEMLAEIEAGTRPVPQGFADIEPELPALVWPV